VRPQAIVILATAPPLVPEHYVLIDLPAPIESTDVTAGPNLVVVDLFQQVGFINPGQPLVLEWTLGGRPRVEHLGSILGTRVTDRPTDGGFGVVDYSTREVLVDGDYGDIVPDIDGNGLPDLHGYVQGVQLQLPDGSWRTVPFPTPEKAPESSHVRFLPLGDIDADGYADVLYAEDTEPLLRYSFVAFQSGHLELFRGGPDGYEATPAWTLDLDAPVADAVAVQNDDDPELELLLYGGDEWSTAYATPNNILFHDLDIRDGVPTATRTWFVDAWSPYGVDTPHIEPFDDVDGDGRNDVIFFVESGDHGVYSTATALLSSTGWDLDQPGFVLTPWAKDGQIVDQRAGGSPRGDAIADIDQDGRLDVVTGHYLSFDAAYAYIWYPSHDVADVDSGHTGAPTADTGSHSTTANDTGPPTDVGPTTDATTAPSPSGPEPKGCGCDASPRFPLSPFARRRAGGSR